ncbi:MAG: WYL domain-containing protein [Thermoplasmataceae archaeon]
MTYHNRSTMKTERIIDIIERKMKFVVAHCHSRNAIRTFKRCRIKNIISVLFSEDFSLCI